MTRRIKNCIFLLLLCLSFPIFSAPFPRQIQDGREQNLIIPALPQRIISQTLATDEILLEICPLERIVGFSPLATDIQYSLISPVVQKSGKAQPANVEQILQLQPDLILAASYNRAETLQQLQAHSALVVQFSHFGSLENIYTNVHLLGTAIGRETQAQTLISNMQKHIKSLQQCVDKQPLKLRTLILDTWHYTQGEHTLAHELLQLAGVRNIAAEQGVKHLQKLDNERLLRWQPELIIVPDKPENFTITRQRLLHHPFIAATPAGLQGRIILLDKRYFEAVSHWVVQGFKQLVEALYPHCIEH